MYIEKPSGTQDSSLLVFLFTGVEYNLLYIEKITFKFVQMKSLAMHITNQKLCFDIQLRSKVNIPLSESAKC